MDIEVTANTAGLAPGNYSGIITATGLGSGPVYSNATYCVNLSVKSTLSLQTLEAEKAVLYGVKIASDKSGFTGTGHADYINTSGDYIQWNVDKSLTGPTQLTFRYANGGTTDRPLKLEVNGVVISSNLPFAPTGAWTNWASESITANLNAGTNKVRLIAIGYSGSNVDHLAYVSDGTVQAQRPAIEQSVILEPSNVLKAFVSPNPASGNAKLVLNTSSPLFVEAEIIAMSGKTYRKMKFFSGGVNRFDFSVKDLPNGMYIIRVKQGNKSGIAKFIVNRKT